ncbi:MAG: hypothetical protein JSR59_02660 [Proteobacteria bacterium]|nr:hypothetical protein [Pseudomonadota bacterium]
MNLASLQAITWSTVTAAVGSALLLASLGAELQDGGTLRNGRVSPVRIAKSTVQVRLPVATADAATLPEAPASRPAEASPPR